MVERLAAVPPGGRIGYQLERGWRIFATALCFTTFGLGGLLLRVLVFPALGVLMRDPAKRQIAARGVIRSSFYFFIRMMYRLGIYTYEFHGQERLQRSGQLILANHPSLIDVVFLGAHVPNADCVVNGRLASNPFTRGPVRAAGYICNDSGQGLIEDCIASLQAGGNLIIFPEGTRSRPGQAMTFQRGAANIAVRGVRAITPVLIHCDPPMLLKGQKWYKVPLRRPHFIFRVQPDLPLADLMTEGEGAALAARHVTQALHNYFTTEIARHAGA